MVHLQSCSTFEYRYVPVAGSGRLEVETGRDAPLLLFLSSVCPSTSSSGRWFQLRATGMKGKDFFPSSQSWGCTESWENGTEELGEIRWSWELTVISKAGWTEQGKILLSQLLQFGSGWKLVSHIWQVKWLPWCHSQVTTSKVKFCVLGAYFHKDY